MSIFRDYNSREYQHSDRSANDRARHRYRVREAIREHLPDIIGEEAIIGASGDKVVKVPIKGLKEWQFVFGDNESDVAQGDGESQPGNVVGQRRGRRKRSGGHEGGQDEGEDIYETEITLDELIEMMFDDLELPELERKPLKESEVADSRKRIGYQRKGIPIRLDKYKTARERIKRMKAAERVA